jgi:hypothetical protein
LQAATGGDALFERPPSWQLQIDFGEATRMATLTKLRLPSIIEEVRRVAFGAAARPPSAIGSPQFKEGTRTCRILA